MVSDRAYCLSTRTSDERVEVLPSSLSKLHKEHPWGMHVNGERYEVGYWPGDWRSGMFGGNSNWRGPICESGYCTTTEILTLVSSQGLLPTSYLLRVYNDSTNTMEMICR